MPLEVPTDAGSGLRSHIMRTQLSSTLTQGQAVSVGQAPVRGPQCFGESRGRKVAWRQNISGTPLGIKRPVVTMHFEAGLQRDCLSDVASCVVPKWPSKQTRRASGEGRSLPVGVGGGNDSAPECWAGHAQGLETRCQEQLPLCPPGGLAAESGCIFLRTSGAPPTSRA